MFVMCCFYYYQKLQSFFLPNIDVAAPAKPVPKLGHCHQPAFLLSKLILQTKSFFCQYKKIVQNITIGRVDTFSILLDLLRVNQWCTTTTYNYIFFQTLAHQIKKNVFGGKVTNNEEDSIKLRCSILSKSLKYWMRWNIDIFLTFPLNWQFSVPSQTQQ